MQTKELSIEIPKGYEIDSLDKVSGKIKFKEVPKSIIERIKTTNDVLSVLGELDQDVKDYRKLVEVFGDSHITNNQLAVCITKALNENWTPDWNDSNQYKYFIWFDMRGSSGFRCYDYGYWDSRSGVGSRLCFKSSELAKYAGTQFTEVYKKFML